ncbi:MAG TPA: alpha/beta hydrolase [Acidimicrobiales bacterium]|nr:alpha/beta hydrolase [Acidimicrobiales bacterium]
MPGQRHGHGDGGGGHRGRTLARLLAAAAAGVCLLGGCTPASKAPSASKPSASATTTATSSTRGTNGTTTTEPPLPVTPVQWSGCGSGLQCGSVTVPLDYSQPQGATIQIAVERHPAEVPSQRIGSLVINPGGPGGSGINDLPDELGVLTSGLLDDFDIVSFDPRGVQRSAPVVCGSNGGPADTTSALPDPAPATADAQLALLSNAEGYASQCDQDSGSILPYVGTVDTARDLDRIRAALGDARLTFIGHSYGTLLGATYAQMFPTHVRAMVLDAAIDPAMSTEQYILDQAKSLEAVLDDFLASCQGSSSCSWRLTGDPASALLALIARSRQQPIPAGNGRSAGPGEIYDALLSGLYSQSSWPSLANALGEAAAGNSSAVLSMSDGYRQNGSTNGSDAAEAIFCLDHPVSRDTSTYAAFAGAVGSSAPVFGPLLAWGVLGCAVWPAPPTRTPAPAIAPGSAPILVTGATRDPVTPYQWAVNLAHELQHGFLLTWQGENHVSYYYSNCVRNIDQAYLISGSLPAVGTVCSD